jgi:hypothetical protein
MQVTKKLTIAQALEGAAVDDDMPVGWLNSFVEKVKRATPDKQNGEVMVRGAAGIYAEWQHTLSPQEEMEARLDELIRKAVQIQSMLPRKGESMSAEQVDTLRRIIG